ncbi:Fgf13: Fibroblast growth factor 13 [Crotalus adamanteus]|uniref:Fgf13: Fibroblast growth factor 13 n=1 Tax=Crotalus adamanteus TaxID=8729 RepID=A0AAW1AVX7_CROAD
MDDASPGTQEYIMLRQDSIQSTELKKRQSPFRTKCHEIFCCPLKQVHLKENTELEGLCSMHLFFPFALFGFPSPTFFLPFLFFFFFFHFFFALFSGKAVPGLLSLMLQDMRSCLEFISPCFCLLVNVG